MSKFRMSEEDINRSKLVEPGWYNVEVTDCQDAMSKAGDSVNTTLTMKILDGPFKGAILFKLYNEKAPGLAIPLLKALGVEIVPDMEVDLEATKGRKVRAYVKNEEWQGVVRNRVEDFRPLD